VKKFLSSISALAVAMLMLVGAAPSASAQDAAAKPMQPVVVVSLAGYDAIYNDLDYLGKISNNPDLAKGLDGMIALFTQWQGLAGLDKARPWGAAVNTDGLQFQSLVFLPVTDLKKLMGALAGVIGEPEAVGEDGKKGDKGDENAKTAKVWRINLPSASFYVTEQNGWAFIAQSEDSFVDLPKDPVKLLAGLNKEYDLAVRLDVQNIPEVFRQMAIDYMKQGMQSGLKRQEGETDSQYQLRTKFMQQQLQQISTAINEVDEVTLGWSIDAAGKRTYLDFSMTAVAGSKLSKQMAVPQPTSKFAGFLDPEAVFRMHVNSAIGEEDIEGGLSMIESLKTELVNEIETSKNFDTDKERADVKALLDEAIEVANATLKKGIFNGGLHVTGEGPFLFVGGAAVDGGDKLEDIFKKVVELAKDDPNFPAVKFNADKYEGINFHTFSVPLPEDDDDDDKDAKKADDKADKKDADDKAADDKASDDDDDVDPRDIFGDSIIVTLGFGPNSVYAAVGKHGVKAIKEIIDGSAGGASGTTLPVELAVSLAPIFEFFSDEDDKDPMLAAMAETLDEDGKDHIYLTAKTIGNGVVYRLEAEEGILKLLGQAAKQAANRGGAGGL
jgi:hypothetical protein